MVDITQEFPIMEGAGISINLAFSNTILINSSGVEQRIIKWQDPIRSFNFARKILTHGDVVDIGNFYDLCKGCNYSFWYEDKSDYLSDKQGFLYPAPDGSRTDFQVIKKYQIGNNIHYRPITEINVLLQISQGNTILAGWTLHDSGKVSFLTAPSTSTLLKAVFKFYVPVTFDSDQFTYKINSPNTYEVDKLLLKEIKQTPYLYPVDVVQDTPATGVNVVSFPSNIDYLAQNEDSSNYDTEVITLSSGFRYRTPRLNIPIFRQLFGQRKTFNQDQLNILLAFWLANKANAAQFYYTDYVLTGDTILARFNTQELTYTLTSTSYVYQLNPLEIKLYRGTTSPTLDQPLQTPSDILSYPLMTLARVCNISVPTIGSPIVFGFTTADRDITIDGQIYIASTAFEPSALEKNLTWAVNNQEIKTVIQSSQITEAELASGFFDKATVIVAVVDYMNPPTTLSGSIIEQTGIIGEITTSDTLFYMENLSRASTLLKQPISIKTSPYCPYNFGDSKCTVNATTYSYTANVVNATSFTNTPRFLMVDNVNIPDHQLMTGYCMFTSGANNNLSFMIFDNVYQPSTNTTLITLNIPAFFQMLAGDTVILQGGCNKQFSTCSGLYNNAINFGGIPSIGNFMPNNDFYLASPI
jgi:uncharacterized phage protein (TIGR02218 family)/uncharacterized protein (TIGR02217 family)